MAEHRIDAKLCHGISLSIIILGKNQARGDVKIVVSRGEVEGKATFFCVNVSNYPFGKAHIEQFSCILMEINFELRYTHALSTLNAFTRALYGPTG
jgi:hypothetical protein